MLKLETFASNYQLQTTLFKVSVSVAKAFCVIVVEKLLLMVSVLRVAFY